MAQATQAKPKAGNGSGAAERPGRVAAAASFSMYEQENLCWRHVCSAETTTDDLESPGYLTAISKKLQDYDLVHVLSADGRRYWQMIVVQGGRSAEGIGPGRARAVALPGYPVELPKFERAGAEELPEGYRIEWNSFTRRHVPWWNAIPLDRDGTPRREDARAMVLHHAEQAARVARKES